MIVSGSRIYLTSLGVLCTAGVAILMCKRSTLRNKKEDDEKTSASSGSVGVVTPPESPNSINVISVNGVGVGVSGTVGNNSLNRKKELKSEQQQQQKTSHIPISMLSAEASLLSSRTVCSQMRRSSGGSWRGEQVAASYPANA